MIWDDKADGLLLALWNEGGSLGFVADGMKKAGYNVSRNSVAGRKHRLAPEQIMRKVGRPIKTMAKQPRQQRSNTMTEKKPRPVTISDVDAIAQHEGIDYLELTAFGCKAILSDQPRGGQWMLQRVCGLPRCEGSPYCLTHFRIYTNPQPVRRANG